jgi:hypothetical protein
VLLLVISSRGGNCVLACVEWSGKELLLLVLSGRGGNCCCVQWSGREMCCCLCSVVGEGNVLLLVISSRGGNGVVTFIQWCYRYIQLQ